MNSDLDYSWRRAAFSGFSDRQQSYERFLAAIERTAERDPARTVDNGAVAAPATRSPSTHAETRWRPRDGVAHEWVSTWLVDAPVRAAASRGREFAAVHLGIAEPDLRFFKSAADGRGDFHAEPGKDGFAWTDRNLIGIDASCSWTVAAEIAGHETFHIARPNAREADAEAYGEWAAELLISPRGDLAGIHRFDGWPAKFGTLAARCEPFDILFAEGADGQPQVYRNLGAWRAPSWSAHFRSCPV